jgi:hypothetical protein
MIKYKPNLVTFIPDNSPYTLSPLSEPGFYVLYQPSTSRTAPLLVYFDGFNSPELYGWTTFVPLTCQGQSNYSTGKCSFLFQAVEESTSYWQQSTESINKTDIVITGRFTSPKIPKNNQFTKGEFYCLYSLNNIDAFSLDKIVTGYGELELGFISYRQPPAEVLVSQKTFGTAVIANLRGIGKYNEVLESLNFVNQFNKVELVEAVEDVSDYPSFVWSATTQTLTFSNNTYETILLFDGEISGFFTIGSRVRYTSRNNVYFVIIDSQNPTISLNDLVVSPNVTMTVGIGNQKTEIRLS